MRILRTNAQDMLAPDAKEALEKERQYMSTNLDAEKQKSQTENGINNEEESGFTSEPECNNC